jgi:endonuclease/exonuclease/phosphatase family metal-dependent hydrolase
MHAILQRDAAEPGDRHVFILGDLNHELDDTETSNPIRLAIDNGYQDLAAPPRGEELQAYHTFPADAPNRRIDFISSRKSVKALNQKVVNSLASDHLPVAVTANLKSEE